MNASYAVNALYANASVAPNVTIGNATLHDLFTVPLSTEVNRTGYMAAPNDTCATGVLPPVESDPWLNFAPCAMQVAILLSWTLILARPRYPWLALCTSSATVCLQGGALIDTLGTLSATGAAALSVWLAAPLVGLAAALADRCEVGNFHKITRLACFVHAMCWALVFPPMLLGLWGATPTIQGALYVPVPRSVYSFAPGSRAPTGFAIAEACRGLSATMCTQLYGRTVARPRRPCMWLALPFALFTGATVLTLSSSPCPTTSTSTCYPTVPWTFICRGSYPLSCKVDSVRFLNLVALVTVTASAEPFAVWMEVLWKPTRAVVAAGYITALALLPHLLISSTLLGPLDTVPDVTTSTSSPCLPFRSVATLAYLGVAQSLTVGLGVDLFVPQRVTQTGTITWNGFDMRP